MRLRFVALMTCLSVAPAGGQAAKIDSATSVHVAVVGNDYSFTGLTPTIAAGRTLFSFENRGTVRHEMSMILLKPGVTLKDVLDRPNAATGRAMAESLTGLLIARPGEAGGGQLAVDLRPGQRYLVICTLKNAPDSLPHAKLGMVMTFDVPSIAH